MIKFGTSGFRGVLADTFTKENVQRVAHSLLQIIKEDKKKNVQIAIGYDNRFMGKEFAQWMAEVLCTDVSVKIFKESAPSPMLTWFTKTYDFGIVITASHNPYTYNGIKIFLHGARECDDTFARRIENIANNLELDKIIALDYQKALKSKKIEEINNYNDYCDSILTHFDVKKIQKSGTKVLVNCMHGNSVNCIKYLFKKLKLKDYKLQNDDIDPYFEFKAPAPYVSNLMQQAKDVVSDKYDVGFALDGDSDRFTLISSNGKIYDCNYVAAVLYYYFLSQKKYRGSIVKNAAFSNLANKISDDFGFNCYDAKTGFKNISPILESTDAFIGAESNGIAFRDHILSKDGIFVAIAVLDLLAHIKKPFHEILDEIQNKYNFKSTILEAAYPVSNEKKKEIISLLFDKKAYPICGNKKIVSVDIEEGVKINYDNGYWGMIRFSGTESVIRIFAEMKTKKECDKIFACYERFLGISERQ